MKQLNRPTLSTIEPDFHDIARQLKAMLISGNSRDAKAWKDLLETAAGSQIADWFAAIGELDQYSIARAFEEMFTETASLDSSVYGNFLNNGSYLKRKEPPYSVMRLPDSSNVEIPSGITPPSPGETDPVFLNQWYLNPHFDFEEYTANIASPGRGQSKAFWGYGKLKREATGLNVAPFTIPPYTSFSTSDGNFFNRRAIIFDAIPVSTTHPDTFVYSGWYGYHQNADGTKTPAILYRGNIIDRVYKASGRDSFSITSVEDNFQVSDSDNSIFLDNNQIRVVKRGLWEFKNQNDVVTEMTQSDGTCRIVFGNTNYGAKPNVNQMIRWRYVVTKGLEDVVTAFKRPNISMQRASNLQFDLDTTIDTMISPTVGGSNQPTAGDYKTYGPSLGGVKTGAVTPQDYYAMFKDYSTGIVDVQVDGQRNLDPSNPKYMNLVRVVTYPKFTMQEYNTMFDEIYKRSMFSNRFFTDENYPILRPFNIRANVYCTGEVDFLTIRDNHIQPAILGLVDRMGDPKVGVLNQNITVDDIRDAIKNSHPSIDYIELLEPTMDVAGHIVSPQITRLTAQGSAGTKDYDYAVIVFNEVTINGQVTLVSTNVYESHIGERRGLPATTVDVHFMKIPNFDYTPAVRNPTSSQRYLNTLSYQLAKKNLTTGIWKFVTVRIPEADLTMHPDHTASIRDPTPNADGTVAGTGSLPLPLINTCMPTVPVLLNDWKAEGVINLFASDRRL